MGNPINAQTDDTGLRYYTFNDQRLLSATSLRRVLGMGFGLHNWVISQVVAGAVAARTDPSTRTMSDEEYSKVVRKAGTMKRDEAASLGTSVHEAAEAGVRAARLPDTDLRKPYLTQYEAALAELGIEVLLNEAQVFNLSLGYAGSLDFIGRATIDVPKYGIKAGDIPLVDLKTGKGIYNDHALQLALYYGAEFVGGYDPQDDKDVVYVDQTSILKQTTGAAILHLRPDAWDWVPIPITDELAAAAVDLTRLATWFVNHPTLDTLKGVA